MRNDDITSKQNDLIRPREESVILGIDPGTCITGFGIIKCVNHRLIALDYGCIKPPRKYKLSDRYLIIFEALNVLIDKFKPSILAVETQYVKDNVQSALKLGMARGIAILAAKMKGMGIVEYGPTQPKLAVTGTGKAKKHQVQEMVKLILSLKNSLPEDAADALALAICHVHHLQTARVLGQEI